MTDPSELRKLIDIERDTRHRELRELEDKLRNRIHEAISVSSKVEGMVTEVRVSTNERNMRLEEQQRQTRTEVASIEAKLDGLREAVDNKLESQRTSIEAKLEALRLSIDGDLKIFRKDFNDDMTGIKVAVGKIDMKTIGLVSLVVIVANVFGPTILG